MDKALKLSEEFHLKYEHAANIIKLIDDGNTIPFIARYRKEMHGGCDDQVLREFADRLTYLDNLLKRKEEVRASIEGQGKWTDELAAALEAAATMTEVEDVYRPYKQKKKTRASVAVERGLEPLADIIQAQGACDDIAALAAQYVDAEKGVETPADAIAGAKDIIAERISDDAELRKTLRELLYNEGELSVKGAAAEDNPKRGVYEMYFDFSEKVKTLPSHRILAINRGEKDECLKVGITLDTELALAKIRAAFKKESPFAAVMEEAIADSYDRLIFPSVEREVRNELTDKADEQAIKMFEVNLRPLLMQPPLKGKVIMGFDPGYRTGCKIAVIDANGNVLDHTVVYPTPPKCDTERAAAELLRLIKKHNVTVISIGNGTASKESEIFIAEMIRDSGIEGLGYIVVNEAGASVYSASKLAAEEFPDFDVTTRSAVSIARRLLDPLAELIKIDVKSIGVGQYQHDMPQKRLAEVLEGVVEDCVNSVGVDLNTASQSLLSYVSGLNASVARNIVEYRKTKPFTRRSQLTEVPKLGPKAYEQCAGFLRIPSGENVLDNTAVHPEAYAAAEKLLAGFGLTDEDVKAGRIKGLKDKVKARGIETVAAEVGVGVPTLTDMLDEMEKPGRDVRDELPPPVLRADLMDLKDLKPGMELTGTVRNVIDFGAFVDIGVHQDGLVHISEISNNYIKHPSEALKVGDTVKVKVIGVDVDKKRISLSIKQASGAAPRDPRPRRDDRNTRDDRRPQDGKNRGGRDAREFRDGRSRPQASLEEMLKALQNKFNK